MSWSLVFEKVELVQPGRGRGRNDLSQFCEGVSAEPLRQQVEFSVLKFSSKKVNAKGGHVFDLENLKLRSERLANTFKIFSERPVWPREKVLLNLPRTAANLTKFVFLGGREPFFLVQLAFMVRHRTL